MPTSLETLPPELLYIILSFCDPFSSAHLPLHPLHALAATSHHIRAVVEDYCRGMLKKHAGIEVKALKAQGKSKAKGRGTAKTNVIRHRWLKWTQNTCVICKRVSRRKGIFERGMTVCSGCDRRCWPKMTMSEVERKHHLSKLDLFTPNILYPDLPPLLHGAYTVNGGRAMMLSTPDVKARITLIGGKIEDGSASALTRRRHQRHSSIMVGLGLTFDEVDGRAQWRKNSNWTSSALTKSSSAGVHYRLEEPLKKAKRLLEYEWSIMDLPHSWEEIDLALGATVDTAIPT